MSRFLNKGLSLMHKSGLRMFSSSSSSSGPFLRLGIAFKEDKDVPDDIFLFDAAKEELLTVPEAPCPQKLTDTTVVASSLGWGFYSGPGLVPNSIYLTESPFGVYHLPTKSLLHFEDEPSQGKAEVQPSLGKGEVQLPHWLPPVSSIDLSI